MTIEVAVIGTGWVGGIRAMASADNPQVSKLHIAEIRPDRLAELEAQLKPATATLDYKELLANPAIKAVMISTTPEATHYPITRDCLLAGKHVLVEKPIASTENEAEELIALAEEKRLILTVGYSQRFNPRVAFIRKVIQSGEIGEPVTCLSSRNVTVSLGNKIRGRTKLSLAAMEATHDLDFLFWCLEPRRPIRVYSQVAGKYLAQKFGPGAPDHQWILVTMNDGTTVVVGAGAILPTGYPNYCQTWMQIVGTEGTLSIDDSHQEVTLNTRKSGIQYPMSSMPGEYVMDHTFAGPMAKETDYFIDSITRGRPVLVKPKEARVVMDVYIAADISAERNEPVNLPRNARLGD
jgi:scyllo-inositol 2-dehydrogenase (NAD+)